MLTCNRTVAFYTRIFRSFSSKFGHSPFGILLTFGAAHRPWYPFRADPTPPSGHGANLILTYVYIRSELMTGKDRNTIKWAQLFLSHPLSALH